MTNLVLELDIHYFDLRTMNDHGPDWFLILFLWTKGPFFLKMFLFSRKLTIKNKLKKIVGPHFF